MTMIIATLIATAVIIAILSVGIYGWPGDLPYNEAQARKYDRRALRLDKRADRFAASGPNARANALRDAAANSRSLAAALRTPAPRYIPNKFDGESVRLPTRKI